MKQKFEIPYNFDFALVDKLLPYKEFIDFVYMPSFYEDGGNSRKDLVIKESVPYEWEEYLNHLSTIQNNFDVSVPISDITDLTGPLYFNYAVRHNENISAYSVYTGIKDLILDTDLVY